MKVLMINVVCGIKSTGRICTDLATALEKQGHEVKIAYGRGNVPQPFQKYAVKIGTDIDVKLHIVKSRLLDRTGFGSKKTTEKFIQWVREYDPDVIHLHNLHGYYINIDVLFDYLRTCGKKIIWTLHDCWPFTGHCAYFDYVGCDKWKNMCEKCKNKSEYPARIGPDMSKYNYIAKRNCFTGIENMILVTPSKWLSNLVKQSFLGEYPVCVIPNGVDTDLFKPHTGNMKDHYHIKDKKIILGVAAVWDRRKGLDTFIRLSQEISDDYRIVLVGLTGKQIENIPSNMIGIEKINNISELVELYSVAHVFINPTLEDNYPTTNLEAIACGTPVITFATGGSPESAVLYGEVVDNNIHSIIAAIEHADTYKPKKFDIDYKEMVRMYLRLYDDKGDWNETSIICNEPTSTL